MESSLTIERYTSHLVLLSKSLKQLSLKPVVGETEVVFRELQVLSDSIRRLIGAEIMNIAPAHITALARSNLVHHHRYQQMRRLSSPVASSEEADWLAQADQDWCLSWDAAAKQRAFCLYRLYRQPFEIRHPPSICGLEDPHILSQYVAFLLEMPHVRGEQDFTKYRSHLCRTTEFLTGLVAGEYAGDLRRAVAQTAVKHYSILPALAHGNESIDVARARSDFLSVLASQVGVQSERTTRVSGVSTSRVGLLVNSIWPTRSNWVALSVAEALAALGVHLILISDDNAAAVHHDVHFSQRLFDSVSDIVQLRGPPSSMRATLDGLELDGLVVATDRGQTAAGSLDVALSSPSIAPRHLALGYPLPGCFISNATHQLTNQVDNQSGQDGAYPVHVNAPLMPPPCMAPNRPFPLIHANDLLPPSVPLVMLTQLNEWQLCPVQAMLWEALLMAASEAMLIVVEEDTPREQAISYGIPFNARLHQLMPKSAVRDRIITLPRKRGFPSQVAELLKRSDIYLEPLYYSGNGILADAVAAGCVPLIVDRPGPVRASQTALLREFDLESCIHASPDAAVEVVAEYAQNRESLLELKAYVKKAWADSGAAITDKLKDELAIALKSVFPHIDSGAKLELGKETSQTLDDAVELFRS